jgi:DNA-binding protein
MFLRQHLELIDDDVVMKARGIAINRGVRVE